jgi:hypothetical protein
MAADPAAITPERYRDGPRFAFGDGPALVDAAFAFDEGEDDRTLTSWRSGHERYFRRLGVFAPDMPLICERFRLVELLTATESDE